MATIQSTKQSTKTINAIIKKNFEVYEKEQKKKIRFIVKKKRKFNVRPRKEAVHLPNEIWDIIYKFKTILEQRDRMKTILPILKNVWISAMSDLEHDSQLYLRTGVFFKGRSKSSKADNDFGWTHQRISHRGYHQRLYNNQEISYLNDKNHPFAYLTPIKKNIGERWVPFVESKAYLTDSDFQLYFQNKEELDRD